MFWFLFVSLSFASGEVVTLKKGEKAPFDGTLLSPDAAATIIVESDSSIQKCKIESEKNLALQQAKLNLEIKNKEASFAACTLKQVEMEKIYEKQIEFLEKQAVKPEWHPTVYFVAGVVTSAAMIYGSSVILKNIGE